MIFFIVKWFQVSICKFKFTGGAKPTLEEKKMLSVDSGGNFRYFNGNQQQTGNSSSPNNNIFSKNFESSSSLLSHQPFPGKSTSGFELNRRLPLGAVDLISAFEALPERNGNSSATADGRRQWRSTFYNCLKSQKHFNKPCNTCMFVLRQGTSITYCTWK